MRELMAYVASPREERGATAVFFALTLVILIGALGLSVDVGNVGYEQTKAQHAADTAARQMAYQCARYPLNQPCATLQSSATTIAGESIAGGTVTATRDAAAGTVKVTVGKTVDTNLLSVVGVDSKQVFASATAKFGVMQPSEAYDVLPLGVHYCTWKKYSDLAGTSKEATRKTTLRTDVLQAYEGLLAPIPSNLVNTVDTKQLTEQLGTDAVQRCTDADGNQVLTPNGASWMIDKTLAGEVSGKLFHWDSQNCTLDVSMDLVTHLRARTNSGYLPQGCPSHFGPGKLVARNKTILLPIFKPRSDLHDRLDLRLWSCASLFPTSATCAEIVPKIGVEVVGFAPFHVTGWRFSNPNDPDPSVPACHDIPLRLNLRGLIVSILGEADLPPEYDAAPTSLAASISCHGLQGYFTHSFTKVPNATYEIGDENFGASYTSLVE